MNEQVSAVPTGAGALLRQAREAKNLSLEHLASLLKVPESKLVALEEDRYSDLPGLAFVRSLAMSVCRQLDLDTQPVLDSLPKFAGPSADLEHVTRGLATPYQASEARFLPGLPAGLPEGLTPGVVAAGVLLVLAMAFWFTPTTRGWLGGASAAISASSAASAAEFSVSTVGLASGALAASSPKVGVGAVGGTTAGMLDAARIAASAGLVSSTGVPVVPAVVGSGSSITVNVPNGGTASAVGAAAPVAAAASGVLVIQSSKGSWIEVRDSRSVLLSRTVAAGEVVPLDGQAPFKIKIGNAAGVALMFQGQPVDLTAATKDNIARLELK